MRIATPASGSLRSRADGTGNSRKSDACYARSNHGAVCVRTPESHLVMKRSLEPELMDSDAIVGPVLDRFHRDLARVNRMLGSFQTIERFVRKDSQPIKRVLDIGCGGGDLLVYLRG